MKKWITKLEKTTRELSNNADYIDIKPSTVLLLIIEIKNLEEIIADTHEIINVHTKHGLISALTAEFLINTLKLNN